MDGRYIPSPTEEDNPPISEDGYIYYQHTKDCGCGGNSCATEFIDSFPPKNTTVLCYYTPGNYDSPPLYDNSYRVGLFIFTYVLIGFSTLFVIIYLAQYANMYFYSSNYINSKRESQIIVKYPSTNPYSSDTKTINTKKLYSEVYKIGLEAFDYNIKENP